MSFHTAKAASCTHYWGTSLIYNFAVEANRRRPYHCQQPLENKLAFSSISPLHSLQWAAFLKWCAGLLGLMWAVNQISEGPGIDSGDDEEILMHIYQLIKGQSQEPLPFCPFPPLSGFFRHFNSPHHSCFPLEIPPSRLTRKAFMFLVFHTLSTGLQPDCLSQMVLMYKGGRCIKST